MTINPLWDKYHLSLPSIEDVQHQMYVHHDYRYIDDNYRKDAERYITLAQWCHHSVSDYWESHPESVGTLLYYDVANMVCKKWLDEACAILDKHGMMVKL